MKAWTIARIGRTEICVHPAFPLLILLSIVLGYGSTIFWMLAVLCVHEASHAVAAMLLGLTVSKLEFMPFGGVAQVGGLTDVQPWKEMLIALAGPFSNLLMIVVAVVGMCYAWWSGRQVQSFVRCNMMLMLFNLIPALPLDGGRMCKALLSPWIGIARSTRIFSLLGMMLAAALFALGVVSLFYGIANITLFCSSTYLFYAAASAREGVVAQFIHRLSNRAQEIEKKGTTPIRWIAVSQDFPISSIPSRLSANGYYMLVVVGDDLQTLGIIPENQLLEALTLNQGRTALEALNQYHEPTKEQSAQEQFARGQKKKMSWNL